MSVRVKICGVTSAADAAMVVAAGADMIGLNFFARSKRFLSAKAAREVVAEIPPEVMRVGVFVNSSRSEIEEIRQALDLAMIQLHGDESPELLRGWPCPVVRAVRVGAAEDVTAALASSQADYYLLDGPAGAAYGGAGVGFEWDHARSVPRERCIVAGGLRPETVGAAVRELSPFAVDVASGVESSPGIKDAVATAEFVENAKSA